MDEGLYGFLAEPIHSSDDRYRTLPRFDLTSKGPHDIPFGVILPQSSLVPVATAGTWSCKLYAGSTPQRRILAFPSATTTDFDAELRSFCDGFLSPVASPPARRTYDPNNPLHMADLSMRFVGIGDERLRRTIELNRGLLPGTGRVPVHPFPQGKF
jgi:hypothetical protein